MNRPRPLSHEIRWLLAGIFLGWAQAVAPKPGLPLDPDYEPTHDFNDACAKAGKAIERLPL